MNDKQKERLETYRDLFSHDGWELLCREVLDPEIEELPGRVFIHAKTWEEVISARAAYVKLVELRSLPNLLEAQAEQYQDEIDAQEDN